MIGKCPSVGSGRQSGDAGNEPCSLLGAAPGAGSAGGGGGGLGMLTFGALTAHLERGSAACALSQ